MGQGFNQFYDLESLGCGFGNGIVKEDTLLLIGAIRNNNTSPWGVALIKADTNGNLIGVYPYFDPAGNTIAIGDNYDLNLLPDNKVAILAGTSTTASLIIYNSSGGIIYTHKTTYDNVYSVVTYDFEEYLGGYIIGGALSEPGGGFKSMLTRTDAQGNVIWEQRYNLPGLDENSRCMKVLDENTIVVGAVSGVFFGPSPWNLSRIFAVDSLGILKWEWQSEEGYGLISDIEKLENGDWLFLQKRNVYPAPDSILAYNQLVRCDSNFNLIWEQRLSPTLWTHAYTNELLPTPDGHWIVSENTALTGPDFTWTGAEGKAGCLTKVTSEGEILWQVCDSIHWNVPAAVSDEFVGGHVVLPSGSSILIGRSNRWQPSPPRSFGWMFKVDENGCMVESACTTDVVEVVPEGNRMQIYPNPARDELTLVFPVEIKAVHLQLFNSLGKLAYNAAIEEGTEKKVLDISHLAPGFYGIRITDEKGILFTEKLMVQR